MVLSLLFLHPWIKAANDPAFKRRGDYDLVEVAKLIPGKQVSIELRPRPI